MKEKALAINAGAFLFYIQLNLDIKPLQLGCVVLYLHFTKVRY